MAERQTRTHDPLEDTFMRGTASLETPPSQLPAVLPAAQGDTAVNIFGNVITAQRVAVRRDTEGVLQRMLKFAARMGDAYYYSIPFRKKNKQTGDIEVEHVEGPTIVLANDLAREWGNCALETRVVDSGPNWTFYSRFTDYETGYQLTRAFQQRKAQETGMKDEGRRLDMVFQIGQSKSQRNVVVNALQSIAHLIESEAKKGLLERVAKNPEEARKWILGKIKEFGIDLKRIEEIYARSSANWTTADMAQLYAELRSISEGVASADDIYPPKEKEAASTATENVQQPVTGKRPFVDPHLNVVVVDSDIPVTVGQELMIDGKAWRVLEVTDAKVHVERVAPPQQPSGSAPDAGKPSDDTAPAGGKRAQRGTRKGQPPAQDQPSAATTPSTTAAEAPPAPPRNPTNLFSE